MVSPAWPTTGKRSDPRVINVCLATPLFYPEYSGAATRFSRYIPGLKDRGVHFHVLAAEIGAWKRHRSFTSECYAATPDGGISVPVHRIPLPRKSRSNRAGRWRTRWMYEAGVWAHCSNPYTRPDVLIWLNSPSISFLRVLLGLRKTGIPTVHVGTMASRLDYTSFKHKLIHGFRPLCYRAVDRIVVGSEVMREDFRRAGVETGIEVIPHGVDLTRFRPDPAAATSLRLRLGLDDTSEIVLFAGAIVERKGLDYLPAAWDQVAAQHSRAHLVLVGPEGSPDGNAPSFADRLRQEFRASRGGDRVIFAGPTERMEEYLQAADVFAFPSRREGMPNVVCEAYASALPCVLTPFVGLSREFGRPGEQYLLADHDADDIAKAIGTLLTNATTRRQIGDSARRWAETYLDLNVALDRYAQLCRQLARPSPPGPFILPLSADTEFGQLRHENELRNDGS
jgi:glycosyltransferase involved in cell wall biosynthesis